MKKKDKKERISEKHRRVLIICFILCVIGGIIQQLAVLPWFTNIIIGAFVSVTTTWLHKSYPFNWKSLSQAVAVGILGAHLWTTGMAIRRAILSSKIGKHSKERFEAPVENSSFHGVYPNLDFHIQLGQIPESQISTCPFDDRTYVILI